MEIITLNNGLRIALESHEHSKSAAINLFIRSGNANEDDSTMGMSHFIEHIVFKGSKNRSQREIYERSDFMGGSLNAFTTKEYTCFYARVLDYNAPEMLDIICDMAMNPRLNNEDILSEQGVVLEEISMYEDSPDDLCADLQNTVAWKGSPLAYNILGTRDTVKSFNAPKISEFITKFYVPERMVVSLCGKFNRDAVMEVIEKRLGGLKNGNSPAKTLTTAFNGGIILCDKKVEQTHLSFGFSGVPLLDEKYFAAGMFSAIVGGNSSSPLNIKIRENLGLAYSVYSFHTAYTSCGIFGISGAVCHDNQKDFLTESIKILKDSIANLKGDALTMVKEQYKSAIVMSEDSVSGIAASAGRQLTLTNRYIDIEKTVDIIDSITLNDISAAAKAITSPENIAISVVGKPEHEDFYKQIFLNM